MELLMPFIDKSNSYVNGFECGQIWTRMEQKYQFNNYPFHSSNTEQIEMMCIQFLYEYRIEVLDETWSSLFATAAIS